ncbi:MAG: hypothetical protein IPK81_07535 [Rhodospirillales bacterium]|nr:MAG: hypothetical protein IPK81_07535 [Rhodospirillales bacterium]
MGFIGKFMLVAAVIGLALFGWRWWQAANGRLGARRDARRDEVRPPSRPPADDLVSCGVCGDYVSVDQGRCARGNCPRG